MTCALPSPFPTLNAADDSDLADRGGLEAIAMELPTSREIELETLLRQRDTQVAELTVSNF